MAFSQFTSRGPKVKDCASAAFLTAYLAEIICSAAA